jgi:hypothetical protein
MAKDKQDTMELNQNSPKPEIVEIEIAKNEAPIVPPAVPAKKERKKYERHSKSNNNVDESMILNISSLLQAGFSIAAIRAGDHWNIDVKEATSIAIPLSKILERYNLLDRANEISEPLALIVAAGTVIIPRVLITVAMNEKPKPQKVLEREGSTNAGSNNQKRNNVGNNQQVTGVDPETSSTNSESIKTLCCEVSQ